MFIYFPQSLRTFPVFSIVFFLTHFNLLSLLWHYAKLPMFIEFSAIFQCKVGQSICVYWFKISFF